MKQLNYFLKTHGWDIAVAFGASASLLCLLLFRLGSLTYGKAAPIEVKSWHDAVSWQNILHDPLYAPYTVVQRMVEMSGHHGITSLRLISVLFAALAAILFYVVARQWHNLRVALLATWLFISSSWFLHVGRLGSPEILWLVSVLAIVVILTPNKHARQNRLALPSTLAILGIVLYVPGMIWLVVAGIIFQRKNIREAWAATSAAWLRLVSILLGFAIIVPLVYALSQTPSLIRRWLGISDGLRLQTSPIRLIGHNLIGIPKSLFYTSSFDAAHGLGRLPLLSSFEIIMLLLGMFFYATHFRAARTRLIVILAGVACLLVGVSGLTAISLVVPVVYLLIAGGVAYILHLWLKVFPSNPIARSLGITVIMVAVLLTSVYQTRSYFVAWRYNPETARTFQTKL